MQAEPTPTQKFRMLLAEVGTTLTTTDETAARGYPSKCDPMIVLKAFNLAYGIDITLGEYISGLKQHHPTQADRYDLWCKQWGIDPGEVV